MNEKEYKQLLENQCIEYHKRLREQEKKSNRFTMESVFFAIALTISGFIRNPNEWWWLLIPLNPWGICEYRWIKRDGY